MISITQKSPTDLQLMISFLNSTSWAVSHIACSPVDSFLWSGCLWRKKQYIHIYCVRDVMWGEIKTTGSLLLAQWVMRQFLFLLFCHLSNTKMFFYAWTEIWWVTKINRKVEPEIPRNDQAPVGTEAGKHCSFEVCSLASDVLAANSFFSRHPSFSSSLWYERSTELPHRTVMCHV